MAFREVSCTMFQTHRSYASRPHWKNKIERERERERESMYQVNISCRVEMRVKNWKRELIDMHVNGVGWSNT